MLNGSAIRRLAAAGPDLGDRDLRRRQRLGKRLHRQHHDHQHRDDADHRLDLSFNFAVSISSIWNASIVSHNGSPYTLQNVGYDTIILSPGRKRDDRVQRLARETRERTGELRFEWCVNYVKAGQRMLEWTARSRRSAELLEPFTLLHPGRVFEYPDRALLRIE